MEGMQKTMELVVSNGENLRFANLRGVQWRINLGILPSSSSSTDDLRRVTADSRRRYAVMRRHLLVDPHMPKESKSSSNLVIDNPLSQNPDSTWGRFFRNAELEKTVDQDLSRLYPEHESYFQAHGCQGMLRRILLLWCIRHPEFGYRQGMHELLAPLLYVLHVDVNHLSEVRKQYEDHFSDKFDELPFQESDAAYNFDFKKYLDSMEEEIGSQGSRKKIKSLDELDPEIQTIVLLSDAYGTEGELGIVLSERYLEHDAYCMFDALMIGVHGSVAMSDFFAYLPESGSQSGLPPVIEASAALYHQLSVVDSSLHSHLVELGVEPQYFALRWLRVLFGREFTLDNLLIVWDEIFAAENRKVENSSSEDDPTSSFRILTSPRGAFIAGMAVSMMLHLRSSLLATENATSCLQKLLNFPENVDVRKVIEKAKTLKALTLCAHITSASGACNRTQSVVVSGHTLPSDAISTNTPLNIVPDSYWEEKWRVMQKEEEARKGGLEKQIPPRKKWSDKLRLSLRSSVRRSLLDDLSGQMGYEKETANVVDCCKVTTTAEKDHQFLDVDSAKAQSPKNHGEVTDETDHHLLDVDRVEVHSQKEENCSVDVRETEAEVERKNTFDFPPEDNCSSGNSGSEENLSIFSDSTSLVRGDNDHENDSEKSSVASNVFVEENPDHSRTSTESLQLQASNAPPAEPECDNNINNNNDISKPMAGLIERKLSLSKFPWFRRFIRNSSPPGESSEKEKCVVQPTKSDNDESGECHSSAAASPTDSSSDGKSNADQKVMGTLRNLGQSMIEHIQVIESVFQQDRGQAVSLENFTKNVLVEKGQNTAMTALKELRKISNLLSEM